jgi:catecholate siderophore receptor
MAHIRSRKHSKPVHLLALLAASVPAAGMAQPTATLPTVTVKEAPEVPYKADKSANEKIVAPLLDTPKTIQIIKKETLEEQGAVSLVEALRNTPGITMQMGENGNTSAGDTFQLRGQSIQQSIFQDGIRDLGAVSRDTFNLEQVEIVKGAAGAESGRGAATGAINLISKQAHLGDENNASVTLGTGSRKRATVDLNKQLSETSAFRVNAMAQDSGVDGRDFVENKGGGLGLSYVTGLGTPTRIHLFSQHLRQKNTPDGGIPSLGYPGYFRTAVTGTTPVSQAQANAMNAATKANRENFYGAATDREKIDSDMFTAKVEHDLGQGTTIRNITRLGKNHMDRTLTGIGAVTATVATNPATWTAARSRQNVDQENKIFANQTSVNTEFATGSVQHTLAAGVEVLHEKLTNFGRASVTVPGAVAGANLYNPNPYEPMNTFGARTGAETSGTTNTIGLYAFDNAKLNDRWSINGGLRADVYKVTTDTIAATGRTVLSDSSSLVSWSIGAVYKPAENGSVYASYANAKTPPANDGIISTSATSLSNPIFDPQTTSIIELGTKWELLDKRLNLNAAVFRSVNENQISYELGSTVPQQIGEKQATGIEISAVGQITRLWQVTAAIAHTDVKQKNQRSNAGVSTSFASWDPSFTATLWTSYQLDKLTLGVGARHVSKQKRNGINDSTALAATNMPEIPSYSVVDAMVAYQVSDKISLRLNVYNLFDKEHIVSMNNNGNRIALGLPRSAAVTANFKF